MTDQRGSATPERTGATGNPPARPAAHASGAPSAEQPAKAFARRRSDAIRAARVLCILGVVYVHAWIGLTGRQLAALQGTAQGDLRWVLMETFGHSAVPLLGVISGWLVAGSTRTRDWRSHIARKARTILLPMVAWNAAGVALVLGATAALHLHGPQPSGPEWFVQEIFVLTRNPDINVQMPFLRDLFVCMVAASLLVRLPSRALVVVVLLAALAQVFGVGWPILLRPAILMFFAIGMLARRADAPERIARWPLVPTLAPFIILLAVKLTSDLEPAPLMGETAEAAFDLVERFAAAIALWRLSWLVAGSPLRDAIVRIEPCAFLLFCAHVVLIWLFGPFIGRITGPLGAPLYPAYFVAQPFLVLAATLGIARVLVRFAPPLARTLSGGRLARTPHPAGD